MQIKIKNTTRYPIWIKGEKLAVGEEKEFELTKQELEKVRRSVLGRLEIKYKEKTEKKRGDKE